MWVGTAVSPYLVPCLQVKVNLKIAGVKDRALHLSIKVGPFILLHTFP